MAGSEWENYGQEIKRTVQDAVEHQDYSRLNQTITETLDRAMGATLDSMSKGIKSARGYAGRGAFAQPQRTGAVQAQPQPPVLYKKTKGARTTGLVLGLMGGICGACFGLVALAVFLAGALTGFSTGFLLSCLFFGVPALCCFGVMGYGLGLRGLEKRFQTLIQVIGSREYCDVKELASTTGNSRRKIIKDLEKMTRKGWFLEGHFDDTGKCFITSNRMYQEYKRLDGQRKEEAARLEEQRRQEAVEARERGEKLSPEARKVVEAGDEFIHKIHACNDAIPGEEISAKISRMELIIDRIFDRIEQNPEAIPDIRKLMEYYLPTTVKLLEAYQELDAQPVAGENIETSKREIEATLDTLNQAFEKILDDLFHQTAWDVSSDISVLHTMLAQEGLTDDGIKLQK